MSKGNIFLGYGRGSVGDVVFSRVNGQQVARARNRKPANPRSTSQMVQRSRFAYLSKFYSKATKAFFKFAFEMKRPNESDYNAFMRANVGITPHATKQMVADPNTPYVGPFAVCRGSLPSLNSFVVLSGFNLSFGYSYSQANPTVGNLSTSFMEDNPSIQVGDILTFCLICASQTTTPVEDLEEAMNHDALFFDNSVSPSWRIVQIEVNPNDSRKLSDVGFNIAHQTESYTPEIVGNGSPVCGGIVVMSRRTADGLKVGNADIILSTGAQTAYEIGITDAWADYAAISWGPSEDAILEGALLPRQE